MNKKKGLDAKNMTDDESAAHHSTDDFEEDPLASVLPQWDLVPPQVVIKRVRKKP